VLITKLISQFLVLSMEPGYRRNMTLKHAK